MKHRGGGPNGIHGQKIDNAGSNGSGIIIALVVVTPLVIITAIHFVGLIAQVFIPKK